MDMNTLINDIANDMQVEVQSRYIADMIANAGKREGHSFVVVPSEVEGSYIITKEEWVSSLFE